MKIENSFAVQAPPDRVYEYLLDVNKVVACVPGAELSELVDPDTFTGKVRIKVGPVTVSYNGTAHIDARDPAARTATLRAEGRETKGSGSAKSTTTMAVAADGAGATVLLATDFMVVGRVAQFGRGIMEDVSKRIVGQMAECIRSRLEAAEAAGDSRADPDPGPGDPPPGASAVETAANTDLAPAAPAVAESASAPRSSPPPSPVAPATPFVADEPAPAAAIDALALGRAVAADRLRSLSRRPRLVALLAGIGGLLALALRRRRHRHG